MSLEARKPCGIDPPIVTPATPDLDIVYICSHGRSGSTLVGSVLGLCDGYCYVGEVRDVWTDGLAENLPCGCGRPFRAPQLRSENHAESESAEPAWAVFSWSSRQ